MGKPYRETACGRAGRSGVLSEEHLRTIRATKQPNQNLLDAVISSGLVSEEEIAQALADRYGLPYVRLASVPIDSSLFRFVPDEMARKHHYVPIKLEDHS